MFQKDRAHRRRARGRRLRRLAVIAQAVTEARLVMHLPAAAFTPPPKVTSAVVHLVPKPDRPDREPPGAPPCEAAGIEPDARAEVIRTGVSPSASGA